jgi:lipopolysaccharide biosynthesis glycosyltransferase
MLHSVLAHSGDYDVRVHYLHGPGLPDGDRGKLARMIADQGGEVSFQAVPGDLCEGLPTHGFTLEATWYRIFVPDLLPEVDRILFLDADLLALRPLAELWETDVSEHYLAAVTNVFQADHLFRAAQLGFDQPETYFNAGVMLLNLDLMRRDGCAAAMRDYGLAHGRELMFRDQDVLNAVLAGRRLALHPRWNCMNSFEAFPWAAYVFGASALAQATGEPAVRHFEGPDANKPWHRACSASQRELYFEERRATPWPAVDMEGEGEAAAPLGRRLARRVRRRLRA